jgi:major membrane immunogen (membrane-anchored lipoprotein)
MEKIKIIGILFCMALIAVLSSCNKSEGIRGTYRSVDGDNDTLWFDYASKVQVNLDGEILEGTYKITDKTILITIADSDKLIVLTLVDEKSILRQHNGLKVFTRK